MVQQQIYFEDTLKCNPLSLTSDPGKSTSNMSLSSTGVANVCAEKCMNTALPDVAISETSHILAALDEVGMDGIDLPLRLDEADALGTVRARAGVYVDLPVPDVKGIHMSRLHRLLGEFAATQVLTLAAMGELLQACVLSQDGCGTQRARLTLDFELLLHRPALVTSGLGGWKSYPVQIQAHWNAGKFWVDTWVTVVYSSTCPCSAALTRQLVEQAFVAEFGTQAAVSINAAASWLRGHATLATPHSQRSDAKIGVRHLSGQGKLALRELIDTAEAALGTPVQTAVKRADEQAFAQLNGQNLMYVEDAARRLHQAMALSFNAYQVRVTHRESLHAHDAVAQVSHGWAL
jgi:GTP cyclohydrolase I